MDSIPSKNVLDELRAIDSTGFPCQRCPSRKAAIHEIERLRAVLSEFVDFQITDYFRQSAAAKKYCDLRRNGIRILGGRPNLNAECLSCGRRYEAVKGHQCSADETTAPPCRCVGEECHGADEAKRYGYRCTREDIDNSMPHQ